MPKPEASLPAEFPSYRRFDIVSPSVNTVFEPRKFSAKHSEFVQLSAFGVHSENPSEQYKVVVEYPDGSSSQINLQRGNTKEGLI